MSLEEASKIVGELAIIGGVIVGAIRVMYTNLKLHLKEEFATKEDIKCIDKKLDYMMGRRPVAKHYTKEGRVNTDG